MQIDSHIGIFSEKFYYQILKSELVKKSIVKIEIRKSTNKRYIINLMLLIVESCLAFLYK